MKKQGRVGERWVWDETDKKKLTGWWGAGREVHEGEDTCVLMADSRCCMEDTTSHSNYPPVKNKEINRHPEDNHSSVSFHGLSRRDPSQEETPDSRKMEAEEETSVKTWPFALQPGSPDRGFQRNQWDTDTGIC